jgi:hypothetical protein
LNRCEVKNGTVAVCRDCGRFMARFAQAGQKGGNRFEPRFNQADAVLDADFETVSESKPMPSKPNVKPDEVAPTISAQPTLTFHHPDKTGMSVFGKKPGILVRDDTVAFYGFGAALVLLSFWVSGGQSLFAKLDTTTTSSIRSDMSSTEFKDASWRVVTLGGKSALHVEGIVRNSGAKSAHAKPVLVSVKHLDGSSKRYLLGQKGWTLGPGQEVVVSGRLDIASASVASVDIALLD